MTVSCLFLIPQITPTKPMEQLRQMKDIQRFIKPAIEGARLAPFENQFSGVEVIDISDKLIRQVCEAGVLIIDANCYETDGLFRLSPLLYYYMALAHTLGNNTILVTRDRAHLPPKLQTLHHTLTYSEDNNRFIEEFKGLVEDILQKGDSDLVNQFADNPIQDYLIKIEQAKELAKERQRSARQEAEIEALRQGSLRSKKIEFRPIN